MDTFRDIAPYRGQDFLDAVARVKQNKAGIGEILASVVPKEQRLTLPGLAEKTAYVLEQLDHVENYDDFQRTITAGVFLPMILENSVDAFTISGTEHLDSESSYLYVSTHRDIILDCALIDLALAKEGQMLCEMAIGDNLLLNEFVTDL
ncbi:MAG TPA: glycerol acyltransferase, partial [Sphaerochaeta sp.]|nr:glycerol acyltransferase [Sphaerochaeta sp.]